MIERGLKKERESAKTFGVVIFIIDDDKRVFVLQENEENLTTGKKLGDYSVICESRGYRESVYENMWRGICEESGIPNGELSGVIDFGDYKIWETQFKDRVWSTVFVLRCSNPGEFIKLVGTNLEPDGVNPIGFLPRKDFEKLNLREGVKSIMERFGDNIFNNEKINTH